MFVEVNKLNALVIDISFEDDLREWGPLSLKYRCAFLVNTQEQISELKQYVTGTSVILIKRGPFFLRFSVYEAMRELDVEPYETAFVTSSFSSLTNLLDEPIGTVLLTPGFEYDQVGSLPDLYAENPKDLENTLSKYPGYFGENFSTIVNEVAINNAGKIFFFNFDFNNLSLNVTALGRYFGPRHHKNRLHQFSHRLRKSKTDISQESLFTEMIAALLPKSTFDGITRVPPRPSDTRDRFAPIVEKLSQRFNIENLTNCLICTEDFPKQKEQANRDERKSNVKNVFSVTDDIKNKKILLIDDIFTTGATVGECATTLLKNGAKEVNILVLAVNQLHRILFQDDREELQCPNNCGGTMQLRINKNGKGAFFGCSNFFNHSCNKIIPFQQAIKKINMLNEKYKEEEHGGELIF